MRKVIVAFGIAMLFLLDTPAPAQQRTLAEARRLNAARQSSKDAWKPNLSPALKNRLRLLFPCDEKGGGLCADLQSHKNYEGDYVGHDEPAMVFYSNGPSSGSSSVFRLTLPMDPPTPPLQDGTGGTFNPMLHLAFGTAWRCATPSRRRTSPMPVCRTATRTSSTTLIRRRPTSSPSTRVAR